MTNQHLTTVCIMAFAFIVAFNHDGYILPVVGFQLGRFLEICALSAAGCLVFYALAFAAISSQKKGRD